MRHTIQPKALPHLGLDAALVVIDDQHLDNSHAVGRGADRKEELAVRLLFTVCLVPAPAGGVEGDGAALAALHSHMTTVVWAEEEQEQH